MKVDKTLNVLMILSNPFMVDPRVYKEAKSLVDAGYSVTVIVWDRHNDYESEDMVDGIKVVRIHNTGLMKFLSYDLLRNPLWWRKAYKKGLELYKNGFNFDVVHCHDLDTLLTGVWLKKKLRTKLVYDAHEIFGYMVRRTMPKFIVNFAFKMEKKLVEDVDHIITVNEPIKDYFKIITDKHITIVMNCKDLIGKEYQPPKNKIFTLIYIGVLNKKRMFPELVDLVGEIGNVKFVIAGKKENLYYEVKKRCELYDNVEFLGSIPFSEVIPKTLESNAVVCILDPNDLNNKIGLQNKVFESMVCGRPIMCCKGTYSGKIVEELNCGMVINYTSESVFGAIMTLRENPKLCEEFGRNALKAAINEYNWENQEKKLIGCYKELEI